MKKPADRFHRTELLLGADAVRRLRNAHVAVAGLGAVGSFAVEALARSGVGRLRIVDFDVIRDSNVNRQLLATTSSLGRPKVEAARARVMDINPDCRVEALPLFVDEQSLPAILDGPPDVLIDAIDSVGPKAKLLAAAVAAGVPLVISGMGAANRTDPLAVRVADISKTTMCPLAKFVRLKLRKAGVTKGIRCVYSVEPSKDAILEEDTEGDYLRRGRKRRTLGSFACVPGVIGLVAAREAIMKIVGGGPD